MNRSRNAFIRSVVVGLALVALITGLGWVVQEHFVAPAPAGHAPGAAASAPAKAAAPVAPEDEAVMVVVMDVEGSVERGHGEAWTPLQVGDTLGHADSIRANAGARAELRVGAEDSQLTLLEGTEVKVEEVTRAVHAFQLKRGRVKVNYLPSEGRVLHLETEDGAVAETHGARFTLLRSGLTVAVATETGSVNLQSAGASVRVGAGEQSVAVAGGPPSAPVPIPKAVLLQVARRAGGEALCATLLGQVRPGTEVWVDGAPADVNREGHFQVQVSRRKGREGVRVEAREPGGSVKEQLVACLPAHTRPLDGGGKADVKFNWDHAP
jgi:hypothetical protein